MTRTLTNPHMSHRPLPPNVADVCRTALAYGVPYMTRSMPQEPSSCAQTSWSRRTPYEWLICLWQYTLSPPDFFRDRHSESTNPHLGMRWFLYNGARSSAPIWPGLAACGHVGTIGSPVSGHIPSQRPLFRRRWWGLHPCILDRHLPRRQGRAVHYTDILPAAPGLLPHNQAAGSLPPCAVSFIRDHTLSEEKYYETKFSNDYRQLG